MVNSNTITTETTAGSTISGTMTSGIITSGTSLHISNITNSWIDGFSYIVYKKKRRSFFGLKKSQGNEPFREIESRAFFRVIKKGLTKPEKKQFLELAEKAFQKAVEYEAIGQKGITEKLEKILNLNLKKATAQFRGYDKIIHSKMIEKYRVNLPTNKELIIDDIEEYDDKPIPPRIVKKLVAVKKDNIFDSFCVFWIRKIKDPILFGQFKEDPDTYYFIAEWDDDISVKDLLKY